MENELVRYSRAGDVFHYRWAARRCLKMIYPKSLLQHITIEGSDERKMAGEYIIDVAEYSSIPESGRKMISFYQLKHTTVRKKKPFNLSDLKKTFNGFAERYSTYLNKNSKHRNPLITFSIVTNRPINENFKRKIDLIGKGNSVDSRFQKALKKYTNLKENLLEEFCSLIKFIDGEGDYNAQRYELHVEISQLLAGTVDDPKIDSITYYCISSGEGFTRF